MLEKSEHKAQSYDIARFGQRSWKWRFKGVVLPVTKVTPRALSDHQQNRFDFFRLGNVKTAPVALRPLLAAGRCWMAVIMLAFLTMAILGTPLPAQQDQPETHRKALQKVAPRYPETAKAIKLSGTVRVGVKVASNGRVVSTEVLGGHPLLAEAAVDAVRHFRFEAAPQQTEEVVIFNFQPVQP